MCLWRQYNYLKWKLSRPSLFWSISTILMPLWDVTWQSKEVCNFKNRKCCFSQRENLWNRRNKAIQGESCLKWNEDYLCKRRPPRSISAKEHNGYRLYSKIIICRHVIIHRARYYNLWICLGFVMLIFFPVFFELVGNLCNLFNTSDRVSHLRHFLFRRTRIN